MRPEPTCCLLDARTRTAWQTQVALAQRPSGLLPLLVQQRHTVFPRFATAYRTRRALPRRVRRYLQRHWRQSLAGLAVALALGQGLALADTIIVHGTLCTLSNAIVTANTDVNTGGCIQLPFATAGADTIVLLTNSVHTLTAVDNTTYGATGLPVVTSEITIKGHGSTIERASGTPDFRILAVSNAGQLTLQHTTISGGVASGPQFGLGGGIFNLDTLVVEESTVSGNSASSGGGGIINSTPNFAFAGMNSTLRLIHSTVSGNTADGGGGGMANSSSFGRTSTVRLIHSTVSGNSADGGGGITNSTFDGTSVVKLTYSTVTGNSSGSGGGGGVSSTSVRGTSTLRLAHSTISGNTTADRGGGVLAGAGGYGTSRVTLSSSTVSSNSAGSDGGGMYHSIGSTVRLNYSTVSDNTAAGNGGGVGNSASRGGVTVRLSHSTVSGNVAGADGGGVSNIAGSHGGILLTLTNSTISSNSAGADGGGVFNFGGFGGSTARLTHSTVSGNYASGSGGGIANQGFTPSLGTTTLTHSLLSGNTAPTGAEVSNLLQGAITANNSNLFGHSGLTNAQAFVSFTPGAADLTATSNGTTPTALSSILDPTLANNGGPTATHNLVSGSPAIDAVPLLNCPPPATDQRGFSRPVDGDGDLVAACDIGAVEFCAAP